MRNIRIENLCKGKNGTCILDKVHLNIPSGEFFALLGPSGCGKTTLLRLIAGFESVDSGRIYLGNQDITNLPVHKRSVNIVFQNYALFPHFSVFDNVAYSLVLLKKPKDEIEYKVHKLLSAFHLEGHEGKLPAELSGGQQQRVALARAIINEPDVLLLDEPLAALDFKLREKMLIELIELQDKLLTTFIYVTHDQFEALTVADHMAIMDHSGNIAQFGTPKEIYEFPHSSFVAKFVGSTNMFEGTLSGLDSNTLFHLEGLGDFQVQLENKKGWMNENCKAVMSIRPEKIFISKKQMTGFSNTVKGTVRSIVYYGRSTQYTVLLQNELMIQVFEQNEEHFSLDDIDYDDEVYLFWQKENVVILEK